MNYEIKKSFEKDIKKIDDKNLLKRIQQTIQEISNSKTVQHIPNIKKLKGYQTSYRIRLGDYRLGIEYSGETLYLVCFLHRKAIYKNFP